MATDASVITAATLGGQAPGGMPTCQNCSTTMTPMWRRDDAGTILCNACGLFLKLHGRSRPVSLKSNIIKSRNRGNATTKQKRKTTDNNTETNTQARAKLQQQAQQATDETPQDQAIEDLTAQNNNIAPQHVFDGLIPIADFNTGSLVQHSPSATSLANTNGEPLTFEAVSAQNALLRTRVSELEVINDLFRGRVSELEQAEREARQAERSKAEDVVRLEAELAKALTKLDEIQK